MTRDEKIAWLKRYAEAEREIDRLTENVQRWASRAERVTVSFSFTPGGNYEGSPQEKALDAIGELQCKIVAQIAAQEAIKAEIEGAIARLDNDRQRQVMRCRYMEGRELQKWELVAVRTHTSFDYVKELHRKALLVLEIPH